MQRFDSALRLNVHLHVLWLDGVHYLIWLRAPRKAWRCPANAEASVTYGSEKGTRNEPFVKGVLCADLDGFSLHAAVRVAAGNRRQLEHLCRNAGRPASIG